MIQPKRMGRAKHVARMEDTINTYRGLVEKPREGDHLGDVGVDVKMDHSELRMGGHGLN